jgi:cation transport ATPase
MEEEKNNKDKYSESAREEAVARMKKRIEEERKAQQEGRPYLQAKGGMSGFRKALLWTAVPIVVLSLIGMAGIAGGLYAEDILQVLLGFLWLGAVLYFAGAVIVLVVYAVIHKREIAAGILAGLGIGIVSLGVSCFAGNALSGGSWF